MNTVLAQPLAPEWVGQLRELGANIQGRTAVVGDRAGEYAAALRRAGAPAPVVVADSFDALGEAADSSLDLVVARRVWKAPAGVDAAVSAARRALAAGGRLVAADFNIERVLDAPLWRYPSQYFYAVHPEVAEALARSSASPVDLSVAAVRARLADVETAEYDETLGEFEDAGAYRDGVAALGWRGFEEVSSDEVDVVLSGLTELLPRLLRSGPVPLREPWHAVSGIKRL